MTNEELDSYFDGIATDHVRDTIHVSQNGDATNQNWMTETDWMGNLIFRSSDGDFDGPVIRGMMAETGLPEQGVLSWLKTKVAEAFDYEVRSLQLDAEIAAAEAEDA